MPEGELTQTYSATPGEVLRYLWGTMRKHWLFFLLMFLVVCAASVCFVLVPVELKKLVDAITSQAPSASSAAGIVGIIIAIVVYRLLGGLFYRSSGYMSTKMVPQIRAELEENGLRGILEHSYSFFADQHTGSLVRRVGRLSDAYERIHATFYWHILGAIAIAFTIIVQLALTRPSAAWIIIIWIIIFSIGNWFVTKWKTPADEERTRKQNASQGLLADIITNATTVKLFAQEKDESRLFHRRLGERVHAEQVAWLRAEHGLTGTDITGAFLTGGILFLALWGWERGNVTVGDFVLLQSFSAMLMDQLFFLGFAYRDFIEALTGASEIVGVLKSKVEVHDVKGAKPLRVSKGRIEFSGVGFAYGGSSILSGFRLDVAPREKLALVGPSGAGKTTVIKLMLRFYDVNEGKILIDGQDIAKATQHSLREQISLVPQDPALFHRSLKDNIAYGKENVSMNKIIEAAKKARCHDFISKLPQGYDTLVGERGIKLSGGERQRVAIARAILADAPILVLDEATSSLDSESELLIQKALAELMKEKTVIVIAHRLSTIMEMDRIIVMQDGKISDEGTHDALRAKVGIYQKLWNIQAGGFQE